MKTCLYFLLFVICVDASAFTVLIDPGHGGEDLGAKSYSHKVWEKDIALDISKQIFEKLKKKKYRVFLTRSFDRTVSLEERAEMADKVKADLFISVHANSSHTKRAHGFETYYLDNHNDQAVMKVEKEENVNLKGEDIVINKILTDLVIERTVKSSRRLAKVVHKEIKKKAEKKYKLTDRGVKPGLFYVLALAKRPGILLEVGFMSNHQELKKITTKKFQKDYSDAVVKGIDNYFKPKKGFSLF